jgi:zinc protease
VTKTEVLNRKVPPPIKEVTELHLPLPEHINLDNGLPMYLTRLGTQPIMKLEITTLAGRQEERKRLTSRATSRLLREGTQHHDAATLAEKLEYYAGTLQSPYNLDNGGLVLYCMTKHFPMLLPLVAEMLYEPTFPDKELTTFIDNNIQRLAVELSKNDVIAYRQITELIYGKDHP